MVHRPTRYAGREDTELVIVLDCTDLRRSAAFWTAALGYVADPLADDDAYLALLPATGEGIEVLLQKVPEAKTGKNRVHLDLRTTDLERELARLIEAGARHTTGLPVEEDGWTWYVLQDPDGNEFCVLRPGQDGDV
ncbi:VOC family protein [Actinospica durhamensis]|uniref:VOC family protein n=1 Tax=Actinospica durhamensis TaxID=1508375 RepID=A0A941EMK6_9ACTN|nr:VOC family protein [Actinospica durhamensis]MBR7833148.1 VOC family protein [Actinospica durhamensis]